MASDPSQSLLDTAALPRAQRSNMLTAVNDDCSLDVGPRYDHTPSAPQDVRIFLYGELSNPEALKRLLCNAGVDLPELMLTPARVLDFDLTSVLGKDTLVPANWWSEKSRFPRPGVDGVCAVLPRQTVMPLLELYYAQGYAEVSVPLLLGESILNAVTCSFQGQGPAPLPPSSRRLFLYGSLTSLTALRWVAKAPANQMLLLVPATLRGWRVRRWGPRLALVTGTDEDSEAIEGCVYDCPGTLLENIDNYEGFSFTPVEVDVTLSGGAEPSQAWCYIWNGALDDLQPA
ncbi:hypothetical protein AURDEDRAFT_165829 [Auricularia subglabra TFB-10046 SS5]|nr:hypothetical protein AURDEDRAFT_165829 [Auricularia subglabra TFB-10046 SS5]